MMTLEHAAALAFRDELLKIAETDGLEKSAAIELFNNMSVDEVEIFLKEAGFFGGLANLGIGAAKGLGSLGWGAARGMGNLAAGTAKGIGGAIGQSFKSVGGAIKAAPGNMGARMSQWGQNLANAGAVKGHQLAARGQTAGQNVGQGIKSWVSGPRQPQQTQLALPAAGGTTNQPIQTAQPAPAPQPAMEAAPQSGTFPTQQAPAQGNVLQPRASRTAVWGAG